VAGSTCCERNSSTEAMTWVLEGDENNVVLRNEANIYWGIND
jgi:hypothetical protein